jgi:hypothetical protein
MCHWEMSPQFTTPGWREEALHSGAVERLRGFPSVDALLRTILLHVGSGFSLRETAVRAKLAEWADVSDVALLKRLRNSESWLRELCLQLLNESGFDGVSGNAPRIRIVDGTIVREPGKPEASGGFGTRSTAGAGMRFLRSHCQRGCRQ